MDLWFIANSKRSGCVAFTPLLFWDGGTAKTIVFQFIPKTLFKAIGKR